MVVHPLGRFHLRRAVHLPLQPAGSDPPGVEPIPRLGSDRGPAGFFLFCQPRRDLNGARRPQAVHDQHSHYHGLGILFLVGVVGVEWRIAPFGPGDGVQGQYSIR